jgi:hypothetical protein
MIRRGNMNLVVVHRDHWNDSGLQAAVDSLEALLRQSMQLQKVAICTQVADLNRYRLYTQPDKVLTILQSNPPHKPFIFPLNLN